MQSKKIYIYKTNDPEYFKKYYHAHKEKYNRRRKKYQWCFTFNNEIKFFDSRKSLIEALNIQRIPLKNDKTI